MLPAPGNMGVCFPQSNEEMSLLCDITHRREVVWIALNTYITLSSIWVSHESEANGFVDPGLVASDWLRVVWVANPHLVPTQINWWGSMFAVPLDTLVSRRGYIYPPSTHTYSHSYSPYKDTLQIVGVSKWNENLSKFNYSSHNSRWVRAKIINRSRLSIRRWLGLVA